MTGPKFDNDRNIILWLDHRPVEETQKINATKHNLLRYVGGTMSIEMEIPKVLWLKNHMPRELFDRCKFYDLTDALTHMATGNETRSFCSTVCKQSFVPVGVDGSVKGWQADFLTDIGLEDLTKDNFKRLGGVNGVVSHLLLNWSCTLPAKRPLEWPISQCWRAGGNPQQKGRPRARFKAWCRCREWCY